MISNHLANNSSSTSLTESAPASAPAPAPGSSSNSKRRGAKSLINEYENINDLEAFYRQSSNLPRNPTNLKLINGVLVNKDLTFASSTEITINEKDLVKEDSEGWVIIDGAPMNTRNSSGPNFPIRSAAARVEPREPRKPPESIFTAVIQSLLNTQTEVLRSEASSPLFEITPVVPEASEGASEYDDYEDENMEADETQPTLIATLNLFDTNPITTTLSCT